MTAPDLDGIRVRAEAEYGWRDADEQIATYRADILALLAEVERLTGTCTRREHMHEPYDTITRLQNEVDKWQASVEWFRAENEGLLVEAIAAEARAERAEAQVQAVRALADESRRTGKRLSALEVSDALGGEAL